MDDFMKNFAMFIPEGPALRDDGKPCVCTLHKEEFIKYLVANGRLKEVQAMTWAQRDEEYLKWEKEHIDQLPKFEYHNVEGGDGKIRIWEFKKPNNE